MKKYIITIALIAGMSAYTNAQTQIPPDVQKILQKNTCLACHNPDKKIIGPSYKEIMAKKGYKADDIINLIYKPNPKNWPGYPPMAAMTQVPKNEAKIIADWIVKLK